MISATESKTKELKCITPPADTAVHVDMTNDRYHAMENWSHSQLKLLPHDPELFEWNYILKREKRSVTRPMECGSALHAWLLEGIEPTTVPADYLTKAGSVKPGGWAAIAAEFPGVPVLKADEVVGLRYARDNAYADPEIRAYLETAGQVEHSLFSVDPETKLPTRIRLDKLCQFTDGLACLDLKYSADITDRWVDKQVSNMAYYSQAGMYWEHVERAYETPREWVFLFVKNGPPYTARLFKMLDHDVELGVRHTHVALRDLRARLDTDDWRGEGYGGVGTIEVKSWVWDVNPEPLEAYCEFTEFSQTNTET